MTSDLTGSMSPAVLEEVFGFAFSDEQLESITAPFDAPLQVIAGAGSGKTTVMAARIVWAVGEGIVEPGNVLGLTFTNMAASDFRRSVTRKLETLRGLGYGPLSLDEAGEPAILTYHGFANRLVSDYGLQVGVEPGARLLADGEPAHLAYRLANESSLPLFELESSVKSIAQRVVKLDQELTEAIATTGEIRKHCVEFSATIEALEKISAADRDARIVAKKRSVLCDLVDEFRQFKRDMGVVDFGDLMRFAQVLSTRDNVVTDMREQWKLVLLDEYQDTSFVQTDFLSRLFGDGHSVTAVGDPFQAIYGWRGASELAMSDFRATFHNSDGSNASQTHLTVSRRSGPAILDAANTVAGPLRDHFPEVKQLRPVEGSTGDTVAAAMLLTVDDEHSWLAKSVASLVKSGVRAQDIAILCRERSIMNPMSEKLAERGIPVQIGDVGGLLSQPEVLDVLSWLRVLADPGANPSMLRILHGPRWRIGPRDLALLGRRARRLADAAAPPRAESAAQGEAQHKSSHSHLDLELDKSVSGVDDVDLPCLLDAIESPFDGSNSENSSYSPEAIERFTKFRELFVELRSMNGLPISELARQVARLTGLESEVMLNSLKRQDEDGNVAYDRGLGALSSFYDLLHSFGDGEGQSLNQFVEWVDLSEKLETPIDLDLPLHGDAVSLLTVHSAKGLEWDYVFVPSLVYPKFPTNRTRSLWTRNPESLPHKFRGDRAGLPELKDFGPSGHKNFRTDMSVHNEREERRLAYVALTRAKVGVFASGSWWSPSTLKAREVSDYLRLVTESVEAGHGIVADWVSEPGDNHPVPASQEVVPWPRALTKGELANRDLASLLVSKAQKAINLDIPDGLSDGEVDEVQQWDRDLKLLLAERRSRTQQVTATLPETLSASQIIDYKKDPEQFLSRLSRPMPRAPAPAAKRGTRFHSWVEDYFDGAALFDAMPDDFDVEEIADEAIESFKSFFLKSPYAQLKPFAIEQEFTIAVGGKVIKGFIDAIYVHEQPDGTQTWEVVDWKTNQTLSADSTQLSVYGLAVERLFGVDSGKVSGTFVYVNAKEIVTFNELLSEDELVALWS